MCEFLASKMTKSEIREENVQRCAGRAGAGIFMHQKAAFSGPNPARWVSKQALLERAGEVSITNSGFY